MSARDSIENLWDRATPVGPLLDAYRAEVMAEFVAWLVKRAREHRAQGPQYAKQADVIGMLADKVSRGAVRPNNLLMLPAQGGPEDMPALRAEADRLRAELTESQKLAKSRAEAVDASKHLFNHVQQVLGGWAECKGCESANNQCDGSLACDEAKDWSRLVDAAWRKS